MARRWAVIVAWRDGPSGDCDELRVSARSAAGAASRARAEWRRKIGGRHPSCEIEKVHVMTAAKKSWFA